MAQALFLPPVAPRRCRGRRWLKPARLQTQLCRRKTQGVASGPLGCSAVALGVHASSNKVACSLSAVEQSGVSIATWRNLDGRGISSSVFFNGVRKRFTTRAERRGRMPAYIRKARLRCAHEGRVGRSLREAPTKWQILPRQGNAQLIGSGEPWKVGPGEP